MYKSEQRAYARWIRKQKWIRKKRVNKRFILWKKKGDKKFVLRKMKIHRMQALVISKQLLELLIYEASYIII